MSTSYSQMPFGMASVPSTSSAMAADRPADPASGINIVLTSHVGGADGISPSDSSPADSGARESDHSHSGKEKETTNGSGGASAIANGKEKEKEKPEPPQHIYDFTKRKGWSGLLLSQLSGTIQFVFSPRGNVMFVSGCVREYLGWEAEEVVERNLVHLLHADDIQPFFAHIHHAVTTRSELAAYTRFRAKDDRTPLFEVRGHPYFVGGNSADETKNDGSGGGDVTMGNGGDGQTGMGGSIVNEYNGYQCFFAMARPYPSRPAALLDSFLDLKIENEHLRQRLASLAQPSPSPAPGSARHPYHTAFYLDQTDGSASVDPSALGGLMKRDPASSSNLSGGDGDAGRKRPKRSALTSKADGKTYVCVMCGRTDSPEWRKGPLGAKTLCNACGLRWAKRNSKRKGSESAMQGGGDALSALLPGVGVGMGDDGMDGILPSVVNPPQHTSMSMLPPAPPGSVNMSAAASGGTVEG